MTAMWTGLLIVAIWPLGVLLIGLWATWSCARSGDLERPDWFMITYWPVFAVMGVGAALIVPLFRFARGFGRAMAHPINKDQADAE